MNMKKILLTMALSLFLVSSAWGAVRFVWNLQASSPTLYCQAGFTYGVEEQLTLPTDHDRGFLLALDDVNNRLYAVTGGAAGAQFRLAVVSLDALELVDTVDIGDASEFQLEGVVAGGTRESDGRLYIVFRHVGAGSANACFGSERCLNLHVFDGTTLITNTDYTSQESREMESAIVTEAGDFVYIVHNKDDSDARLERINADTFVFDTGYDEIIHPSSVTSTDIVESDDRFYFSRDDTDLLERITIGGSGITTMDPLPDSSNDIASFYHAEDAAGTYIVVESDDDISSTAELVLVNEEAFTINRNIEFVPGQHQGKIFGDGIFDSNSITIHSLRNVAAASGRRSIQRVLFTSPLTLENFMLETDLSSSRRSGNAKFSALLNAIYVVDLGSPAVVTKVGLCT